MHWHVPTSHEDATEGGTFWTTACLVPGSKTEDPKKVTCKVCKAYLLHPSTPAMAAARVITKLQAIADADTYNEHVVEVGCGACSMTVDTSAWEYEPRHDLLQRIMNLFEHIAFEHMMGAELAISVTKFEFSAYELNYAVGKASATMHEQAWRERNDLAAPEVVEA